MRPERTTRRRALKLAGAGLLAGPGLPGAVAAAANEIVVSNVGFDESATYEFTVSGSVEPLSSPAGDNVDGNRAWGGVYTWKDGYEFTGEVTSFTHDGPVRVYVNGTEADPDSIGDDGGEESAWHEVVVSNVGFEESATYEFTASGSVEALSNPAGDTVDGNRAWGGVYTWKDGYRFEGRLTSFSHDGPVRLYVDGTEVDPDALGDGGGDEPSPEQPEPTVDHDLIRRRGVPLHDTDDWSRWGPYSQWSDGTARADTSMAYTGAASLVIDSPGGRLGARYSPESALDLTGRRLSMAVRMELPDPRWSQLVTIHCYDAAGRRTEFAVSHPRYMLNEPAGSGWLRVPAYKRLDGADDADLSAITEIRLSSWPGSAARAWVDDIRLHDRRSRGRVAFTFDDGAASQALAVDYMLSQEVPGTLFPIKGWVQSGWRLPLSTLERAHDAGWTVGAHPQRPQALPEMGTTDAAAAMDEEIAWLDTHGFESNVMAWPYGALDTGTLRAAERRFDIAFSTGGSPTAGEVSCPLNIGRLGGSPDEGDGDGVPAEARHAIDRAAAHGETTVLNYHSIDEDDRYTTPLSAFEATVDYAVAADVDIVTGEDIVAGLRE